MTGKIFLSFDITIGVTFILIVPLLSLGKGFKFLKESIYVLEIGLWSNNFLKYICTESGHLMFYI